MKYNIYENGGAINGAVTINGMAPTNFVRLRNDPNGSSEAASKQYVDFLVSTVKAQQVLTGYFDRNVLPGFSGNVESVAGNNILTLANSGVAPNTYTKITLGTNGLVINGGNLSASDIPVLRFSKITTGKPTTLAGYGITDGVNKVNGTVIGSLTTNGDPTLNDDVATKRYVDSKNIGDVRYSPGDLIQGNFSTTPIGFLRCNGAEVSKITYAALYAAMGYPVSSGANIGYGAPYKLQYDFNLTQSGDILTASGYTSLPGNHTAGSCFATKNRVYYCGGASGTNNVISTVRTAPINADGSLGAWSTATSLPGVLQTAGVVITKNRVYLIGGWTNAVTAVNTVYTAPINADGTLGAWVSTTAFPVAISYTTVLTTKDRVYAIGGQNASVELATIYTAPINADGTIGTWTAAGSLPEAITAPLYFAIKNKIYILKPGTNRMYVCTVNADGTLGSWTAAGNAPFNVGMGQFFQSRNTVYLQVAGENGTLSGAIIMANINADGSLGAWSRCTAVLPSYQYQACAIITSSSVYFIGGGSNAGQYSPTVQKCDFTGGLNDYSSFYNGTYTPLTSHDNFYLPNYTSSLDPSGKVFVKF